jgi:prepilin-type N-terminal cleavage/methylation domain-containing protein/prepilin-type processing-associated H-X9-DG protein
MSVQRIRSTASHAFTLVELLVVIGIIAVLIGILLPALSRAREQAGAVKCAAQLREIGNCFQMYAMDNKGYWPPCRLQASYTLSYGKDSVTTSPTYWQNFIAKYVTRVRVGTAVGDATQQNMAKGTILWGCPNFTAYVGTIGGENVLYTGYGMNLDPHYPDAPITSDPYPYTFESGDGHLNYHRAYNPPLVASARGLTDGTWFKAKEWSHPAERCLIADGRAYSLDARRPPQTANLPDAVVAQHNDSMNTLWSPAPLDQSQTTIFIYRHGSSPKPINSDTFGVAGGRIAFNILYCDGHVNTCNHGSDAYRAIRMRFPK